MFSNSNKMLSKTCVRADNVNTVIIIYGGVTVFVVIIIRGLNVLEINTEVVVRNLISIISGKKILYLSEWTVVVTEIFLTTFTVQVRPLSNSHPFMNGKLSIYLSISTVTWMFCAINHNNFQKLFMTTIYKNMKV